MPVRAACAALSCILGFAFTGEAEAAPETYDVSGVLSMQSRWYPEPAAFAGQRSHASGVVAEPTLYLEDAGGRSLILTPFLRYDSADSRRTHADLREAYLLLFGDIGENFRELRLGVDQVFWGVAELLALPYHRKRTFAGTSGRLRPGRLILDEALYESGAEEQHLDVAARYSHSIGLLDFGLSAFVGTNREPFSVPALPPNLLPDDKTPLIPYYEQIRQFGLDAQLTVGSWLYKLEAIHRSGARNLRGREEDYRAFILGAEHTFYSVFESAIDVTLLGEWHDDGRGRWATNAWANDVFLAAHLAFNGVQGTEIAAGLPGDLRRNYRALSVELKRRLTDNWSLRLEVIANLSVDPQDITYDARRDGFVALNLNYNF